MRFSAICSMTAVFLSLALATPAVADEITYTMTAAGSGSVGSTSFTNATLTWTATANTANFQSMSLLNELPFVPFDSDTISIVGLGPLTPTLPFGITTTTNLENFSYNELLFVDTTGNTGFAMTDQGTCTNCDYDLTSNFTGTESLILFTSIQTDEGTLSFTGDPTVTFTASTAAAAPEPRGLAVMLSGLACLAGVRRRALRSAA
jgi:hypothetical protein